MRKRLSWVADRLLLALAYGATVESAAAMALSLRFEGLVREGQVNDYAQLARLGRHRTREGVPSAAANCKRC